MSKEENQVTILIVEDNEIDRVLAGEAFERIGSSNELRFVEDGEELMDYLHHRGKYSDRKADAPRPGLIILDLNLPKKDGFEVLEEIKNDPDLRQIPITVMSASDALKDRLKTYGMGASCFITKPTSLDDLENLMRSLRWWADRD